MLIPRLHVWKATVSRKKLMDTGQAELKTLKVKMENHNALFQVFGAWKTTVTSHNSDVICLIY